MPDKDQILNTMLEIVNPVTGRKVVKGITPFEKSTDVDGVKSETATITWTQQKTNRTMARHRLPPDETPKLLHDLVPSSQFKTEKGKAQITFKLHLDDTLLKQNILKMEQITICPKIKTESSSATK